MDSRNSTVLATQLAVPAMAPELMAASVSYPWHWKNLTRTAKTAASPPMNDVNRLDISRAAHRPYGIGPITAPVTTQALLSTGIWASTNASATHPHLAPSMTLRDPDALLNTARMAHRPIRLPSTIARFIQLIRFASTSLGTSTPIPVASACRSEARNPFCDRAIRSVTGSRV